MGPFNISPQQVLAVIGFFSSLTTAIFWGAYLLGKLVGRIERVENELWDHDTEILRLKGQRPGHEHQRH